MNPVLVTFVFYQRDTCKHEQRHDEIAETPCYIKIDHHNDDKLS